MAVHEVYRKYEDEKAGRVSIVECGGDGCPWCAKESTVVKHTELQRIAVALEDILAVMRRVEKE